MQRNTGLILGVLILLLSACSAVPVAAPEVSGASAPQSAADSARRTNGNLVTLNVPPIPVQTMARVRQYGNSRSASLAGFAGDQILVSTRFGQTNQLHQIASPLGARTQLTFFDEPVASVAVPPVAEPTGFIYGRDIGGSEFFQLFWFDRASGESRLLSDGKSRYGNVRFSRDGARFAYSTTERDGVHHDIHINDVHGNRQIVHESEDGLWVPVDFSPDGDRLLLLQYLSINDARLFEIHLNTGRLDPLLADRVPFAVSAATYTDQGRAVLFAADLDSEFIGLHRLTLGSGAVQTLKDAGDWNVEALSLSADDVHLAYVRNEDGVSRLSVRDLANNQPLSLPELPPGIIGNLQFAPDRRTLGFTLYTATAPGDTYTLDIVDGVLQRWTTSEVGGLNTARFVEPKLIRYPTFDGREIPAFYFRPQGTEAQASETQTRVPVVVLIHGGPEAQYRPYFSATIQFLTTELGIAVIAPNVRGSAGYGKSYLLLDNGYLREDSVKDIGALLDWIGTQPDLDADRVAVYGGSYGGYMVLASLLRYPERLAAGVEAVGISNFVTFLENTQPYRQNLRRVEYGDERDPKMRAFLQKISPLTQLDRLQDPVMISQGANDPRVPASESEQIVSALSSKSIPVWYVLAKDEGHGFRKKNNREYNTAAMALFLQRHLLNQPAESESAATAQ